MSPVFHLLNIPSLIFYPKIVVLANNLLVKKVNLCVKSLYCVKPIQFAEELENMSTSLWAVRIWVGEMQGPWTFRTEEGKKKNMGASTVNTIHFIIHCLKSNSVSVLQYVRAKFIQPLNVYWTPTMSKIPLGTEDLVICNTYPPLYKIFHLLALHSQISINSRDSQGMVERVS